MVTIKQIIDYCDRDKRINAEWSGSKSELGDEIKGVNIDAKAKKGEMAWLSQKQMRIRPNSVKDFMGSLLISSKTSETYGKPVLNVENPKLTFILLVNQFFKELGEIKWPRNGSQVSPNSLLHKSVTLSPGSMIGSNSEIHENVFIGPNTVIANTTIHRNTIIGANCSIGLPGFGYESGYDGKYWRFPHVGGVVIDENVEIGSNTCIDRGSIGNTIIKAGVKIDNLVHIAHNVVIGSNSLIIANAMIGGSTTIEKGVWVAPSVSIMNQTQIGETALLGMGAVVLGNVDEHTVVVGNPARILRKEGKE